MDDLFFLVTKVFKSGQVSLQVVAAPFRSTVERTFKDTDEYLYRIESYLDLQVAELEARLRLTKAMRAIAECEGFADLPDDQADAMYEERDRAQEALDDAEGRATHLLETSKVLKNPGQMASC